MAKKIQQFYYDAKVGTTSEIILPYIRGTIFETAAQGGIEKLGIQTAPGVKFHLNNCIDPVIVGSTGIYELDLNNQLSITGLRFEEESMRNIANSNGVLSLLVDIIYRGE